MATDNDYTVDLTDSGVMPKDTPIDEDVEAGTILQQLTKELEKEIVRPEIEIDVPERESIALRFTPNISQARLREWRRNSGEGSKRGIDSVKFACYVIGDTCTGIYMNKQLVKNSNGVALNFASKDIMDMTEADTPFEAIKRMFGLDPHIESAAFTILEHAGYGDEVDAEDPTSRP